MSTEFNAQQEVQALAKLFSANTDKMYAFEGCIMVHFTDLDEYHGWNISPKTCEYTDSSSKDTAIATINVTSDIYVKMMKSGEMTPEEAFLRRQFTVDGDVGALMKLSHLFQLR